MTVQQPNDHPADWEVEPDMCVSTLIRSQGRLTEILEVCWEGGSAAQVDAARKLAVELASEWETCGGALWAEHLKRSLDDMASSWAAASMRVGFLVERIAEHVADTNVLALSREDILAWQAATDEVLDGRICHPDCYLFDNLPPALGRGIIHTTGT